MNIWAIILGAILVLVGIFVIPEYLLVTPVVDLAVIFIGILIVIAGFLNKKK